MSLLFRTFVDPVDRLYRRSAVADLARAQLLAAGDARTELSFAAGMVAIFSVAFAMWSGLWSVAADGFRRIDVTAATKLPYDCISPECGSCLTGIDENRVGNVFTGGSGAIFGLDVDLIRQNSRVPLINCIIYGTTLDGFPLILNQRNQMSSTQALLHALNSWVMIDGGHLANYEGKLSPYFRPPGYVAPPVEAAKRFLFPILLKRHFSEFQTRLRRRFLSRSRFLNFLPTFPLNQQAHLELKEVLMQRHIKMSPWAASFLQKVDTVPSLDQMRQRVSRIRKGFGSVGRIVMFAMPEYTPITQAQRTEIYAESRRRFLAGLEQFGIEFIDIDYRSCGIDRRDFWTEGGFWIDPVHPNESSKEKITICLINELNKRGVL
jgi:hypothetical protein